MSRLARARTVGFSIGLVAALATAATAQQPVAGTKQAAKSQGTLVLEPINEGFVVTPDVEVTRIDGRDGVLIGAFGGWLMNNGLLLGGGGYFEADTRHHDRDGRDWDRSGWGWNDPGLAYGGFVAAWTAPVGSAVRVGARALVGGGRATLTKTVTFQVPVFLPPRPLTQTNVTYTTVRQEYAFHQGFFVAEPQATLLVRLHRGIWLDLAGGYRMVGAAHGYDSRLRGATGSVGVRFGPRF
ncbi:MAG TPA: hypothetical protein VGK32_20575 [Vicinamibacterales bacterium]|jgi:hypothetical protein